MSSNLLHNQKQERWAVVGGGILGMTLALRLAQAGKSVTLFESSEEAGGLASAWRIGDIVWDRHYHVTLLSDSRTRNLLREIGLEHLMKWVETKTGFYTDGRLYSMSNTLEFLKFPPLGLIDKLRLGATIFYASRIRDWKRLEKVRVEDWLRKLSGKKTFERIWLPLLRSKLGDSYKRTSAAFIWATIARMYAARRSGLKKEMFGYMPGGYATTLDALSQKLISAGVNIRLATRVNSIRNESGSVLVQTKSGREEFDRAVLTVPANLAASICPDLSTEELSKLEGIEYQGIVCASLLLKNPLAEFYVTNITDSWVPFTAVIEMSALADRSEFSGRSLVYLPKYVSSTDPIFSLTDQEIKERFISALKVMYKDFDQSDVLGFRVSRVRQVFPIASLDYSTRLPEVKTSIPGVYILNSAHIVNGTLNVNETIQVAENGLATLLEESDKVEAGRVAEHQHQVRVA
jgi:protoporphyrinogen oxidase